MGGKLGGQHGPRCLIGESQPTDELAAGARNALRRIDLPDLMGLRGAGEVWSPWLRPGPARAIDPCRDERVLEGANRRDGLVPQVFDQWDTN